MGGLLPTHQHRRTRSRKSSPVASKGGALVLFGLFFLGYAGYRRSARIGAGLPSLDPSLDPAAAAAARRDLKEQLLGADAALAAPSGPRLVTTFPAGTDARRLLICTHSRLAWYRYDVDAFGVIHEGQGVYYGGFPGAEIGPNGAPTTVWAVSRPHNWRPTTSKEFLLELDAATGKERTRVPLPSRFTHDTVRTGDRVYAADTGDGHVLELSFPEMTLLRRMELFTLKEHVNTLAPTGNGTMWAMLHNLGSSALAEIDLAAGRERRRLEGVGLKAHGAVQWRGSIIALDSDNAALERINPETGATQRLWAAPATETPRRYLKGLCVVDDIAFFGIAEAQERKARDSVDLNCELGAFDLVEGVLLWRRSLPTRGLLNVVSAPHLQVESTAHAVWVDNHEQSYRATAEYKKALAAAGGGSGGKSDAVPGRPRFSDPFLDGDDGAEGDSTRQSDGLPPLKPTLLETEPLTSADPLAAYPPTMGGRWASGYPRLDNTAKDRAHGLASGAQLPLFRWDASELKAALLALPPEHWTEEGARKHNAFLSGRSGNLNQFKPGTGAIHLIFSDQMGQDVYEFPAYRDRFAPLVDPFLRTLLGADTANIIRAQFAIMPGHSHIKKHIDKGGYSATGHRIHLVVASSPEVSFHVCEGTKCVPIHVEEGLVFELNNRLEHFVDNDGAAARIHLVVDVAEMPRVRTPLKVGQVCAYDAGKIVC